MSNPEPTDIPPQTIYLKCPLGESEKIKGIRGHVPWSYLLSYNSWTPAQGFAILKGYDPHMFINSIKNKKDTPINDLPPWGIHEREQLAEVFFDAVLGGLKIIHPKEWNNWSEDDMFYNAKIAPVVFLKWSMALGWYPILGFPVPEEVKMFIAAPCSEAQEPTASPRQSTKDREIARACALELWATPPYIRKQEVVDAIQARECVKKLNGEPYTDRKIDEWIADLNPSPDGRGRPRDR